MSGFMEGTPGRTPQTRGVSPLGRPRNASRVRPYLCTHWAVVE